MCRSSQACSALVDGGSRCPVTVPFAQLSPTVDPSEVIAKEIGGKGENLGASSATPKQQTNTKTKGSEAIDRRQH